MNPALRRSAAHVFVETLQHPELVEGDAHHLLRVMRLRDGEHVSVSDGNGSWRMCTIATSGNLVPETAIQSDHSQRSILTIAVALPKNNRPEWIVQKLTEIGIDQVQFLETERSIVRWDSARSARNVRKLQTVAREAAMQSRRIWLPTINEPLDLLTFMRTQSANSFASAAEPDGDAISAGVRTVLIGPEGGWTLEELTKIGRRITLGENILRVETAALVAATQMVALGHGRW